MEMRIFTLFEHRSIRASQESAQGFETNLSHSPIRNYSTLTEHILLLIARVTRL